MGNSTVTFKNTSRSTNLTSKFFNRMSSKDSSVDKVDRFWLSLVTPLNVENKILIAYKPDATNGFEMDYDAPHIVIGSDSFYTLLGNEKLAIQGRKYPLVKEDVVPLGASFYSAGTYTISLSEREGIFEGSQPVYLRDNLTGMVTNLSSSSYSFNSNAGEYTDRFEIVYVNGTLSSTDVDKNKIQVYQKENSVIINSPIDITKVNIIDAAGRLIYQTDVKGKYTEINTIKFNSGVYYVVVDGVNNKTTQKILLK